MFSSSVAQSFMREGKISVLRSYLSKEFNQAELDWVWEHARPWPRGIWKQKPSLGQVRRHARRELKRLGEL